MPDREEIISLVRSCVVLNDSGVTAQSISDDYGCLIGEPIPYKSLGYSSLVEFLRSAKELCRVVGSGDDARSVQVFTVKNEETDHITKMVAKQKTKKKPTKKKKLGLGTGFSSRGGRRPGLSRSDYSNHYTKPVSHHVRSSNPSTSMRGGYGGGAASTIHYKKFSSDPLRSGPFSNFRGGGSSTQQPLGLRSSNVQQQNSFAAVNFVSKTTTLSSWNPFSAERKAEKLTKGPSNVNVGGNHTVSAAPVGPRPTSGAAFSNRGGKTMVFGRPSSKQQPPPPNSVFSTRENMIKKRSDINVETCDKSYSTDFLKSSTHNKTMTRTNDNTRREMKVENCDNKPFVNYKMTVQDETAKYNEIPTSSRSDFIVNERNEQKKEDKKKLNRQRSTGRRSHRSPHLLYTEKLTSLTNDLQKFAANDRKSQTRVSNESDFSSNSECKNHLVIDGSKSKKEQLKDVCATRDYQMKPFCTVEYRKGYLSTVTVDSKSYRLYPNVASTHKEAEENLSAIVLRELDAIDSTLQHVAISQSSSSLSKDLEWVKSVIDVVGEVNREGLWSNYVGKRVKLMLTKDQNTELPDNWIERLKELQCFDGVVIQVEEVFAGRYLIKSRKSEGGASELTQSLTLDNRDECEEQDQWEDIASSTSMANTSATSTLTTKKLKQLKPTSTRNHILVNKSLKKRKSFGVPKMSSMIVESDHATTALDDRPPSSNSSSSWTMTSSLSSGGDFEQAGDVLVDRSVASNSAESKIDCERSMTVHFDGVVTNVVSSNLVYVRPCNTLDECSMLCYDDLATEMDLHYFTNTNTSEGDVSEDSKIKLNELSVGDIFAAHIDSEWVRISIVNLIRNEKGEVIKVSSFLLDSGERHLVDMSHLRRLHSKFLNSPPLAISVSLASLEHLENDASALALLQTSLLRKKFCIELSINVSETSPCHLESTIFPNTIIQKEGNGGETHTRARWDSGTGYGVTSHSSVKLYPISAVVRQEGIAIVAVSKEDLSSFSMNQMLLDKVDNRIEGFDADSRVMDRVRQPSSGSVANTICSDFSNLTLSKVQDLTASQCAEKISSNVVVNHHHSMPMSPYAPPFQPKIAPSQYTRSGPPPDSSNFHLTAPTSDLNNNNDLSEVEQFKRNVQKLAASVTGSKNAALRNSPMNTPELHANRRVSNATNASLSYSSDSSSLEDCSMEASSGSHVGIEDRKPIPGFALPKPNSLFDVTVTWASSPSKFGVQPWSSHNQLTSLHERMFWFYENNSAPLNPLNNRMNNGHGPHPHTVDVRGTRNLLSSNGGNNRLLSCGDATFDVFYACKYSIPVQNHFMSSTPSSILASKSKSTERIGVGGGGGQEHGWYRVALANRNSPALLDQTTSAVAVKLVDFGDMAVVRKTDLRILVSQFRDLPMQGFTACLTGVKPMLCTTPHWNSSDWRSVHCCRFQKLVSGRQFVGIVEKVEDSDCFTNQKLNNIGGLYEERIVYFSSMVDTSDQTHDLYLEKVIVDEGIANFVH